MLMVKPGIAYLDIVRQTKDKVLQVLRRIPLKVRAISAKINY